MTVLVTGATGNVGAHVVRELAGGGATVRAFVRDHDRAAAMLGDEIDLAIGDLSEPASIRAALEGADRLFLACGNHPDQVTFETNAIDAAAAAGLQLVVKLSAVGAEPGSPLDFWDQHARIEEHLRGSGLPAVVLRPSFYMSNLLASADGIAQTDRFFLPADGARVAMIDTRNVAAVASVALTQPGHEGRVYTLTGPEAITFQDVASHLSASAQREIAFVAVPDDAARGAMAEAGMPGWLVDNLITLFGILRSGGGAQITDTVRSVTGRAPRSFADFAADHARLFARVPA